LMMKYEELKRQLSQAQVEAEAESDELEFQKKAGLCFLGPLSE